VNSESLLRQRDRTRAIVEGALLGDIAIVFLLMRVYLPVPAVRTLIRTVATVPFVMLAQRRGVKITILAALASYILFSALVGPLLALTAIDIAVAGILVGIGRNLGLPPGINTLWTGVVYSILDLVLPTIASVFIFRYPVSQLIQSARNFVKLVFRGLIGILERLGAPNSFLHDVRGWEAWAVAHWQVMWLGVTVLFGLLMMYLVVLVSEMVLRQIPEETLARRSAA
jgi:uncharacterized protein YybS (DUF2232 family)